MSISNTPDNLLTGAAGQLRRLYRAQLMAQLPGVGLIVSLRPVFVRRLLAESPALYIKLILPLLVSFAICLTIRNCAKGSSLHIFRAVCLNPSDCLRA